jgi:hypothetical protein
VNPASTLCKLLLAASVVSSRYISSQVVLKLEVPIFRISGTWIYFCVWQILEVPLCTQCRIIFWGHETHLLNNVILGGTHLVAC